MPTNAGEFISQIERWKTQDLPFDLRLFGTKVCIEALQTASGFAAVRTGAMKAHIRAWVGTPDLSFNPKVTDQARGTSLSGAQVMQSIARLNARGPSDLYGITSAAPYSDFVNRGTVKMAARPFWQAALEKADSLVIRQSELVPGG